MSYQDQYRKAKQNQKIVTKLKKQGLTNSQIAKLMGISRQRVWQLIKKIGL